MIEILGRPDNTEDILQSPGSVLRVQKTLLILTFRCVFDCIINNIIAENNVNINQNIRLFCKNIKISPSNESFKVHEVEFKAARPM